MATVRLQLRRGLADDWFDANPTLAAGEIGIETDTNTFKFGDGNTPWNSLDYALSGTVDDYIPLSTKAQAGGVASLDNSGFVPVSQLPPLAKVTVSAVADQAARLALTVEPGDIAIQADNGTTYVLESSPATTNSNWKEISATAAISAAVAAHEADTTNVHGIADTSILATTTGSQTLTNKTLTSPVINTPTGIVKADVGLSNVDNTSDANKPVSTATASAIATAKSEAQGYADSQINTLIGAAPAALNTLSELADALGDDANFASTVTTSLSAKAPIASPTFTGNVTLPESTTIGNVSNVEIGYLNEVTSPIQGQLDLKAPLAGPTFTGNVTLPESTTIGNVSNLELGYVNGVTSSIQGQIDDKLAISTAASTYAPLAAPTFTGNVTLPESTTIGNVSNVELGYVNGVTSSIQGQIDDKLEISVAASTYAPLNAPTFTGNVTLPESTTIGNVSNLELGYVNGVTSGIQTQLDDKAPLASPTFTGTVTLPANTITQSMMSDDSVGTNEIGGFAVTAEKLATNSVTESKIADGSVTSAKIADGTIVNADINASAAISQSKIDGLSTSLAAKADLAGPTFTGTVSGITKSMVGLGNVDNTTDAAKPVSTATQTALDLKANLAAPTFTGTVVLPSTTSIGNVSATELGYVDGVTSAIQTQIDSKLALDGGTMTGALTLSGAPTTDLHAATKAYVDNVSAGINFHQPVRVATTANITLSGTQTIDGVAVIAGDRVLVKDQTDQKTNGIYVVASGSWSRATDADNNPAGELAGGDFSLVLEGTVNSGYGYVCSNTSTITIGTTNVTYTPFNAAKAVTAGSGLTESTPGTIDIATGGVTSEMIADGTIVNADINASAAIAQSKISGLTSSLADKAPLASPTFTGTVTVAASGVAFTDGTQTKAGVPSLTTIGTEISADYNLSTGGLTLRDQLIPIAGTRAITVPTNTTTAFPVGTSIDFYQSSGTGANFVPADVSVTILRTPGLKLRTTYSSATLTKVATNTWLLAGDLTA